MIIKDKDGTLDYKLMDKYAKLESLQRNITVGLYITATLATGAVLTSTYALAKGLVDWMYLVPQSTNDLWLIIGGVGLATLATITGSMTHNYTKEIGKISWIIKETQMEDSTQSKADSTHST